MQITIKGERKKKIRDECLMDASISCPCLMNVDDPSEECQHNKLELQHRLKLQMYPNFIKESKASKQIKIRDGCINITSTYDEQQMT